MATVQEWTFVNKDGDLFYFNDPKIEQGVWIPKDNLAELYAEIERINSKYNTDIKIDELECVVKDICDY